MSPLGLVLLALGWSAVVWAGASLICRMKPTPKLAQAIWRGAALMLVAPFAASLFVPGLSMMGVAPLTDVPMLEPLMVGPEGGVAVSAPVSAYNLPEIGTLVLGVLAAGWLVRFVLWLVSQVRLQRIKVRALRTNRPVGHWAEALGLSRVPEIRVIPRGSPFLAGVFRRSVYVPSALIRGEGAQQVIVHELVHLKRGDLIARPLERIVADLLWFSPFAWVIRDQLDFWREAVVDDDTVELTGDRIAYARTLTSAARISRDAAVLPVAAFILRKKGNLKMRLNQLLTEKTRPRRLGLVMAAALACAAPLALAQGMLIKGAAAAPGAPTPAPEDMPVTPAPDLVVAPQTVQEACSPYNTWWADRQPSAFWMARLEASQQDNQKAGLNLGQNWVPEEVTNPQPGYPVAAAKDKISGACEVMFDLGTDGLPRDMMAECSDPVFVEEAARMSGARFKPHIGPNGRSMVVKGQRYPLQFCIE
ncbi:M56 family metallopeptidase [Hyphomonas oceanitis]|uniref:Peptidase M23 n=1 Tax=Hyphomonas oceanitis SCH89 TaxID=1280953 RepID=A0A059GCH7_9PROT|nr:M56 family metallopeptidase [Hyphomonas oceanitis]KDA04424.1 peptidase M23 [Hyphomonas oceanitis SCH89]